ncbi:complement C1q tumor necrosis factor-related protein 1-like [Petromyzon marinus]|uniref:complement C1q tumor necrosis factor-related protein 1-like n=1 Tax=Petromyzon marinus TaxID=7757 RepID=UPI003F715302
MLVHEAALVLAFVVLLPARSFGLAPDESAEGAGEESAGADGESCTRCCPGDQRDAHGSPWHSPTPIISAQSRDLLQGDKGEVGERGKQGLAGKEGKAGPIGPAGGKGDKGLKGSSGQSDKNPFSAFSVGRRKAMHSDDGGQNLLFDLVFVNKASRSSKGDFDMFRGRFRCSVPGIYTFNLNVHTWNLKETYLHLMKNEDEKAILYAQSADRSIMQSQSIMLELRAKDEVWVRLYKKDRENAIFSDNEDVHIIFNGHLVIPTDAEI